MPFYAYRCSKCGTLTSELRRIAERNRLPVCACGSRMDRAWVSGTGVSAWNPEFRFPNLDPTPGRDGTMNFRSKAEYEVYLKEHHLAEKSLGIREV